MSDTTVVESTGGRKDDVGKLRFDLIPVYPLEETARVYTLGAKKYADRNWEKGLSWGRVFAAMMRHAWAWWRGETHDPVDGQHHMASVAWCAFALMEYQHRRTGTDDRPLMPLSPRFAEHQARMDAGRFAHACPDLDHEHPA